MPEKKIVKKSPQNTIDALIVQLVSEAGNDIKKILKNISQPEISVTSVVGIEAAKNRIRKKNFDIVLCDVSGSLNNVELLAKPLFESIKLPIIMLGSRANMELGTRFMHMGAQDTLSKHDLSSEALLKSIQYSIERKKSENRLAKINEYFLNFGPDPRENINSIVKLSGELLKADVALYNRIEGDIISSIGAWNIPEDYSVISKSEGHICNDVMRRGENDVLVIRELGKTKYADTDPNVKLYGLETYIGTSVRFGNHSIGALCVVYKSDFVPDESDKKVMEILASAIGSEEERMRAENALKESQRRYRSIFEDSPMPIWEIDISGIKLKLGELKAKGVKNFRAYIKKHPELVSECVALLKVLDVNKTTLKELGLANKKEFYKSGMTSIFNDSTYASGTNMLIAIAEDATSYECETSYRAFSGAIKDVFVRWSVVPGYEESLSKVLLTSVDITDRKRFEYAIKESEEKFKNLAANSPNMIFINYKGKVVYANPKCSEVLKYNREDFYADDFNFMDLIAPESQGVIKDAYAKHMKGQEVDPYEYTILTKDGKRIETIISTKLINYSDGKAILGIVTDLTEVNKTKKQLRAERDKARMYLDLVGSVVVSLDTKGRVTLINKRGLEIIGRKQEDVIGKLWFDHFVPANVRDMLKYYFNALMASKSDEHQYFKNPVLTGDGEERVILWNNMVLRDDNNKPKGILSAGTDVTESIKFEYEKETLSKEIEKSNRRLKQLSFKDPLTSLYNHRYLAHAVEAAFQRAKKNKISFSILMVDLDYFKSVNDLYGHEFGDFVIKQFARQLKQIVRSSDIVIRSGGEEFVVISPGSDKSTIMNLAERILDNINLFNFGNIKHSVKLTLSIGVVSYPDDKALKGIELIDLAEKIVDKAKNQGGNCVCLSSDLQPVSKQLMKPARQNGEIKVLRSKIDKLNKRAKQNIVESIFAFAKAIELRDHYTGEHVEKTVHYATELAKALGVRKENVELIKQASMLHDLGKVGISDHILLKRAKLSPKEFEEIKRHPQIAADIIRPIQFMHDIIPLIFYHHERWDGKGYPSGLKGEEIPLGARIIALADAYQALTSNRPYRKAFPKKTVINILKRESGQKYDPNVIKVFLELIGKKK